MHFANLNFSDIQTFSYINVIFIFFFQVSRDTLNVSLSFFFFNNSQWKIGSDLFSLPIGKYL